MKPDTWTAFGVGAATAVTAGVLAVPALLAAALGVVGFLLAAAILTLLDGMVQVAVVCRNCGDDDVDQWVHVPVEEGICRLTFPSCAH